MTATCLLDNDTNRRVLRGQAPFMQKNVPKYTPEWIPTVRSWADSVKHEVTYALGNDRRTLLWFANQRAVEYHPALGRGHGAALAAPLPPDAPVPTFEHGQKKSGWFSWF